MVYASEKNAWWEGDTPRDSLVLSSRLFKRFNRNSIKLGKRAFLNKK